MFSMSPEDKLRQVMQYQDAQREQVARERMATASSRHTIERSAARSVESSGARDLWTTARQLWGALTETRGVVRRRAR